MVGGGDIQAGFPGLNNSLAVWTTRWGKWKRQKELVSKNRLEIQLEPIDDVIGILVLGIIHDELGNRRVHRLVPLVETAIAGMPHDGLSEPVDEEATRHRPDFDRGAKRRIGQHSRQLEAPLDRLDYLDGLGSCPLAAQLRNADAEW